MDEWVAEVLRGQILAGEFGPGARLREAALTDRLAVSRGTVRAALWRLAQEGLLEKIPNKGYAVMSVSADAMMELSTLRHALEALAARIVASDPTPARKAAVLAAFERICEAVRQRDRAAAIEADFRLHLTIIEASGHRQLREHYRLIEGQIRLYHWLAEEIMPLEDHVTMHEELVAAILLGDAPRAARLAEEHSTRYGMAMWQVLKRRDEERAMIAPRAMLASAARI
ncbi:GntR family transcriptional regulator [Acuticoccus mangrovi]|uniref:GntR family transcriptional regulator n=1 Tax=Acuticoccus mangrovi TaxID=2796142 RepID=A0A934ITA4_9HYPH|nr:GntR family transcriptional regulator [Acuticoccus mangrovi]MBJ3777630.1 GntR family transcriptional regulator [Acuticoccus mangrovi]